MPNVMPSNKRRRSSSEDSPNPSSTKYVAVHKQPPTLISLPDPVLSNTSTIRTVPSRTRTSSYSSIMQKRRAPLTPPAVTPACVTVSDYTTLQRDTDRCCSPSQRARMLLEKVAIVSSCMPPQQPVPAQPKYWDVTSPRSDLSSLSNTPSATPPEGGSYFPSSARKELPTSPEGEYVSFPVFEAFGDYKSEDEDDEVAPPPRR